VGFGFLETRVSFSVVRRVTWGGVRTEDHVGSSGCGRTSVAREEEASCAYTTAGL
jgi:hypothetical protein